MRRRTSFVPSKSSNRQRSTPVAFSAKRAKLTPSGVSVAPRGYGWSGQGCERFIQVGRRLRRCKRICAFYRLGGKPSERANPLTIIKEDHSCPREVTLSAGTPLRELERLPRMVSAYGV